LISKKDLLERADISYGQLYRWKRKGLIPEEWFIRKSTYTGQETFFPRNKVLSRIDKIKNLKEDVSLDDIADVFSPSPDDVALSRDDLTSKGLVTADVLTMYMADNGERASFDFGEIRLIYIFNSLLTSGSVSLDEGRLVMDLLRTGLLRFGSAIFDVMLTRKLGSFSCFAIPAGCDVCLDKDIRLISRISVPAITEELKLKMFEEENR
jgi:DNA-binding transcriptional MerR regulator